MSRSCVANLPRKLQSQTSHMHTQRDNTGSSEGNNWKNTRMWQSQDRFTHSDHIKHTFDLIPGGYEVAVHFDLFFHVQVNGNS